MISQPERCLPAAGASGSPSTIYELIELINGLPHPVTLTCLVESLDRPLRMNATSNIFSLQPALGPDSPRIFLLTGRLSLAVVPGGEPLLEFGQFDPTARESVKGELFFPIEGLLTPESAFERIALDHGTKCASCHAYEIPSDEYPYRGAYGSLVVRHLDLHYMSLPSVRQAYANCDATLEPERCALFTALFGHGEVIEEDFPAISL